MNHVYLGDCLIESGKIPDGSVDLILTDLPFGTIKGMGLDGWKDKTTEWDNIIDPVSIYNIANRILRKNGKMVLFAQEPFTTTLINKAIPNIPFSYRMIWKKDHFANALLAKKAPVSYYEDILVFSKRNPVNDSEFTHPLRPYFESLHLFIGVSKKKIFEVTGTSADHCFRYKSSQFSLCTEQTYNILISEFGINNFEGFKDFEYLREIDLPHKSSLNNSAALENPSVFNLWQGGKYKSNILEYKKDYDGFHPTQKPVPLLEDLIKTFSNEGDHVVDLTAGSGSTAVACENTDRRYTVIEMNEGYYNTILKRVNKNTHVEQKCIFDDDFNF